MRTFCVSSHHTINPQPWETQGVLLAQSMLKNGIWYSDGSGRNTYDNKVQAEVNLQRCNLEQNYLLLLEVLIEMRANPDDLVAALSLQWDSYFDRFLLPKRVWMGIFLGEKPVAYYSHFGGSKPVYSILEFYDKPVFDKDIWRKRFAEDILAGRNATAA